jgi:hypothetical protein
MYEELIENPKLLTVESITDCNVCDYVVGNCKDCILNMNAISWFKCMTPSRQKLFLLAEWGYTDKNLASIRRHAKIRLKEMLEAIDKGGFTYG